MSESRPVIPADIQRRLMVECGHRCACCGDHIALEKAHIIPWSEKKEHTFENLLVLCSACHDRSHDEKWDRLTLLEYKKNPWVARYRSVPSNSRRAIVEFTLDLDPENFGNTERDRFLTAIAAALDICPKDPVVISIRPGSIIVDVELPREAAETLLRNSEIQRKVRELAGPIKIIEIADARQVMASNSNPFSEANTVDDMILGSAQRAGWEYVPGPQLHRQVHEVMVESWVREALLLLNPEISEQPDRADEVIYNLRACILSVQARRTREGK